MFQPVRTVCEAHHLALHPLPFSLNTKVSDVLRFWFILAKKCLNGVDLLHSTRFPVQEEMKFVSKSCLFLLCLLECCCPSLIRSLLRVFWHVFWRLELLGDVFSKLSARQHCVLKRKLHKSKCPAQ